MVEQEMMDYLQQQQQTMLETVWQWSEVNSGSSNLSGLARMHSLLEHAFQPLADEISCLNFPPYPHISLSGETQQLTTGKCLLIKKRPHLSQRILLCGHMDTVFDQTHPFQQVKLIDDKTLNGPGVTDMKGGLAVAMHALSVFEQHPIASSIGWDVFINADEELGSPASGQYLSDIASNYHYGLVYEPAMTPGGTLAYDRKGSGKFTLVVSGIAAHAGRDFTKGRNAIAHSGLLLNDLHALNKLRDGLTINIGQMAGGKALNIVADTAVIKLDVRYCHQADKPWLLHQLEQLVSKYSQADGFVVTLHGGFGRPVKTITPQSHQLFEQVKSVADKMGLVINWQSSGGCCDGNNLAEKGLPVVDTLGVRGNHIHSDKEYLLIDSLVERAQLSALLLTQLATNLAGR